MSSVSVQDGGERKPEREREKERKGKRERERERKTRNGVVVGVALYNDTERINPSGGVAAATRPA